MEFTDVVRRRRMVRRFTGESVDPDAVRRILELGLRAPSAGFSQGWDFVVLSEAADVQRFWDTTGTGDGEPDRWLRGLRTAPVLIVCCSDPDAYLRRYAEPDKPWQDGLESHWTIPYWDVDTGMAAMIMLLAAVDSGLGGLFFGVPGERADDVREAFAVPADRHLVGVIALGHPQQQAPSGSTRTRRRRSTAEVVHAGRFGVPYDS